MPHKSFECQFKYLFFWYYLCKVYAWSWNVCLSRHGAMEYFTMWNTVCFARKQLRVSRSVHSCWHQGMVRLMPQWSWWTPITLVSIAHLDMKSWGCLESPQGSELVKSLTNSALLINVEMRQYDHQHRVIEMKFRYK